MILFDKGYDHAEAELPEVCSRFAETRRDPPPSLAPLEPHGSPGELGSASRVDARRGAPPERAVQRAAQRVEQAAERCAKCAAPLEQ